MSIKAQVEDALFLSHNGRYVGALTNLTLAIAASSRKIFPQGTKSKEDSSKEMGDREAFTLFLGGRIRKILFGDYGSPDIGNSGILVGFKGKEYDVAYILYKFYRCELVHNGELPEDIVFQPPNPKAGINVINGGVNVSISTGEKMVLDYGWIDLLVKVVVYAKCNGKEFGIEHYELVPLEGINEEEFSKDTVKNYRITPGRFSIFKHAVLNIRPDVVNQSTDEAILSKFKELVQKNVITGGAITGLSSRNLSDKEGNLMPVGLELMRRISEVYRVVKV